MNYSAIKHFSSLKKKKLTALFRLMRKHDTAKVSYRPFSPNDVLQYTTTLGLKRIVHLSYRIVQVQTNEYSNTFEYQTGKLWLIQYSKSQ